MNLTKPKQNATKSKEPWNSTKPTENIQEIRRNLAQPKKFNETHRKPIEITKQITQPKKFNEAYRKSNQIRRIPAQPSKFNEICRKPKRNQMKPSEPKPKPNARGK